MQGFNGTSLEIGQRVRTVGDGMTYRVVGFEASRVIIESRHTQRRFTVDPKIVVGRGESVLTDLVRTVAG